MLPLPQLFVWHDRFSDLESYWRQAWVSDVDWLTETIFYIDSGRCAFENTKRSDDRKGHAIVGLIDSKILQRPLGLRAPVLVCRNLYFPEAITFCARGLVGISFESPMIMKLAQSSSPYLYIVRCRMNLVMLEEGRQKVSFSLKAVRSAEPWKERLKP